MLRSGLEADDVVSFEEDAREKPSIEGRDGIEMSTETVVPAPAAPMRQGRHAGRRDESLEVFVDDSGALSSSFMIGPLTTSAGSASSAGRTWSVAATSRLVVNHVVPKENLESTTLELARKIALRRSWPLRLAKMSVNQTLDAQGFWTAQQSAFNLQHLGHTAMREEVLRRRAGSAAEGVSPSGVDRE